jgi:hypothetical protein
MRLCHPQLHSNGTILSRSGEKSSRAVQEWRSASDTAWVEAQQTAAGAALFHPAAVCSHWWVKCADPFGRGRAPDVAERHGRVSPPGESAVSAALLGTALTKAATDAPGLAKDEQWWP